MSTDSGQWQAPTPGFLYIVKIGDFTHVLKPADQKSSDNLKLAQQAEANIDATRSLFTQHRDFLLADKQIKMDELIGDTEEAINRVIRLLEPSRVEYISEESVRFNTRDPWALSDDHKSAATFGRLQTTHNKLKTVLHDLKNIEATAQLDSCEVRANTAIGLTGSSLPAPNRPLGAGPRDANNLALWKRTQRSKSVGSYGSSTISMLSPNDFANGSITLLNGISPAGTLLTNATGSAPRIPDGNAEDLPRTDMNRDSVSEASGDHLPVIHELEAVLYGSPPSLPRHRKDDVAEARAESREEGKATAPVNGVSRTNTKSTNTSSGVSSSDSPTSNRRKKTTHIKRESFADYRRKIREQRQQELEGEQEHGQEQRQEHAHEREFKSNPRDSLMPSPLFVTNLPTGEHANANEAYNSPPSTDPATGSQQIPPQVADAQVAKGLHQASLRSQTAPIIPTLASESHLSRPSAQHRPASVAGSAPQVTQLPDAQSEHIPRSAMTPRLVSAAEIQRKRDFIDDTETPSSSPLLPMQLTSPLRLQQSPLEQADPLSTLPEHSHSNNSNVRRGLPSVLRAAQVKKPETKTPLPYPVSEAGSDHGNEIQNTDISELRQTQSAVERPLDNLQRPAPWARTTYPPQQAIQQPFASVHDRSPSGPPIPEISVTRVHTISRKPLPGRSASSQGNVEYRSSSTKPPFQLQMPNTDQSHPSNGTTSPHRISPLPSPAIFEVDARQQNPDEPRHHEDGQQRLQPAVSDHSRRSSISAEETFSPPPSKKPPSITNPLAMNPTPAPSRSPQPNPPAVNDALENQHHWQSQHYYQSPAWQQAPHFYPSFPLHAHAQEPGFAPQDNPPQPWQPHRTQTQPSISNQDPSFTTETQQPRRALEQGYVPPHVNAREMQIPPHPTTQAPPPPKHPNHVAPSSQLPTPALTGYIPDLNSPEDSRKPVKDRELFGRQIFRHDEGKQVMPQRPQSVRPPIPQTALPPPPPTVPPPEVSPAYSESRFEQRSPKLNSPLDQRIPNPSLPQPGSAEVPLNLPPANFRQQNEWQYSQQFNRPLAAIAEPQDQAIPEIVSAATVKPKKKPSWLAHHASKLSISAKQNKPVNNASGPGRLPTLADGDETYPDRIRYA